MKLQGTHVVLLIEVGVAHLAVDGGEDTEVISARRKGGAEDADGSLEVPRLA